MEKDFKKGDLVEFHDSEWYVLYDSSDKDDYVTLISADILYLGDDEIYRFIRVYGGNLFFKNDVDSKYYSIRSFLLGEIPYTAYHGSVLRGGCG